MKFDLLNIGVAVFYLNRKLSVFSKGGNRKLLDELESKNLRFSTNMSGKSGGNQRRGPGYTGEKAPW